MARLLRLAAGHAASRAELAGLAQDVVRLRARDDLLLAASRHGVTRLVHEAFMDVPGLEPGLESALDTGANRVLRDHLRVSSELGRVARVLGGAEVPWLALKGPVLAELLYDRSDLREYVDLDVLVEPARFRRAVKALEAAGFLVASDLATSLRERAGEVTLLSPSGVPVDLHWHLVNDWRVRDALVLPSVEDLLARARPARVGGVDLLTLDAVDTLLHLAVHACSSGGWRLLWLRDLHQSVLVDRPDPALVDARAREWTVELRLAAMLARADRVLGPAPGRPGPSVRGSRGWLQLLALTDRLAPVERATGAGSLTRIVTNSTRRDGVGSAAELGRRSAALLRNSMRVHGHVPVRPLPGRPESRRELLEEVERASDR